MENTKPVVEASLVSSRAAPIHSSRARRETRTHLPIRTTGNSPRPIKSNAFVRPIPSRRATSRLSINRESVSAVAALVDSAGGETGCAAGFPAPLPRRPGEPLIEPNGRRGDVIGQTASEQCETKAVIERIAALAEQIGSQSGESEQLEEGRFPRRRGSWSRWFSVVSVSVGEVSAARTP